MAIDRPVLHFLYGADLNPERLAACCPGAEVRAIGELKGFRLAFFGHSDLWDSGEETVVAAAGASVSKYHDYSSSFCVSTTMPPEMLTKALMIIPCSEPSTQPIAK